MFAGQYDHIKKLEVKQVTIGEINNLDLLLIQLHFFQLSFKGRSAANHSLVISCNEEDDSYQFPIVHSGRKIEVQGTD